MRFTRFKPCLFNTRDELRTGAKYRDAFLINRIKQHLALIRKGRAVIQHQRCTAGEARHQPVPHHPAAGGEVEERVLGSNIAVQPVLLQVLNERATRPMDNALGHTGRSR